MRVIILLLLTSIAFAICGYLVHLKRPDLKFITNSIVAIVLGLIVSTLVLLSQYLIMDEKTEQPEKSVSFVGVLRISYEDDRGISGAQVVCNLTTDTVTTGPDGSFRFDSINASYNDFVTLSFIINGTEHPNYRYSITHRSTIIYLY